VHLRLPRVLVEDILRAQCYVEVWRYYNGDRDEIPYVRGERHGTATQWRADGSRRSEIPFVRCERHGIVRWWYADGSRRSEISYVRGERHGFARSWRADGTVEWVEEWKSGALDSWKSGDTTKGANVHNK